MIIEAIITVAILGAAIYILYGRFVKKKSGGCGCGNCSPNKRKK